MVEICALLDGLPLGIELAAARLSLLPPAAIRDRLAARLPLPGSGPRDAPARQRTLEGAIDWSHDLLSPAEQATLHALAVFEGGFDVAQAEPVIAGTDAAAGDALDRLLALGGAQPDRPRPGADRRRGPTRRQWHPVRHAADRPGATPRAVSSADGREAEVRRRHAMAYLDLAETAARHLFAADQPPWIDRLALDQPNLRAALRWSDRRRRDGAGAPVGRGVVALLADHRAARRGRANGPRRRSRCPAPTQPTSARVWALAAAGRHRVLAVGTRAGESSTTAEQLALAQRLGDPAATADAWFNLASTSWVRRRPRGIDSGISTRRDACTSSSATTRGVNRVDLSNAMLLMDDPWARRDGRGAWARSWSARSPSDDAPYVAVAGGTLGWGYFMLGDVNGAARLVIEAMLASYGMRDVAGATIALAGRRARRDRVRPGRGGGADHGRLRGPVRALRRATAGRPRTDLIRETDPGVRLQGLLGPATLAAALERGRRMTIDEAMDLVVRIGDAVPPGDGPF